MMHMIKWTLGTAAGFAGIAFMVLTLLLMLFSFAEWEWLGYDWSVVRLICGFAFGAGLVIGYGIGEQQKP